VTCSTDSSRLAAPRLHVRLDGRHGVVPWLATQVNWPKGARVLEVGCGRWMWAEASARLPIDLELTLTDLSAGMVRRAVERVGSLGCYRRTVGRVADVQELPFRDACVRCRGGQLRAAPRARRRAGRGRDGAVLRPDGVAVVACVGGSH
jgi:SAM-dependent methyltransferase